MGVLADCEFHRSTKIYRSSDDSFCGNDLAVVQIGDLLPVIPAIPSFAPIETGASATFSVVGYGASDAKLNLSGTRRRIDSLTVACVGQACSGGPSAFGAPMAEREFVSSSKGVCEGDSGAPALATRADGSVSVLGVVSRVGYTSSECVGSIYTRIDSWREVISTAGRAAARSGHYAVPDWSKAEMGTSCAVSDDCATSLCASIEAGLVCTQACSDVAPCGLGFVCGAQALCEAVKPSGPEEPKRLSTGCATIGCASGHGSPSAGWLLGVLVLAGAVARRRKAR
jgi:MYXO-CTERM domain-containing protein